MPELSVLIVTYRVADLVRDCLRSVQAETTGVAHEVVVVDNASDDGTAEVVAREFPGVRLTALDENIGFARANNLAAEQARGEYLLLLNPDTVVHDRALVRLLEFARAHPGGGLYGGRTLRPDGSLDPSSCWGLPTAWSAFCFGTGLSTLFPRSPVFDPESLGGWARDGEREVGMVTGCLLLVRRDVWRRLGGFDPAFFMYGEDADLAIRARAVGYRPLVTPAATITHVVGASAAGSGRKMAQIMRSRATLMRRHWAPAPRAFGLAMLLMGVGLRALASRVVDRPTARGGSPAFWRETWRDRRSWIRGYPATGTPRRPSSRASA